LSSESKSKSDEKASSFFTAGVPLPVSEQYEGH
jgi:hypothetical protein